MRYFITTSKDATVYSASQNQNTGIDQILEVSKWNTTALDDYSRAFIEFDYTGLDNLTNPTFSLQLSSTKLRELPLSFDLKILPISGAWERGIGKKHDNPKTTKGVSFRWRDLVNGSAWVSTGGDFRTSFTSSFQYNQHAVDLNADITDIVNATLEASFSNDGLAIKFPDNIETGSVSYGTVNFFSSETNTIYRPKLVVEYFDADNTGRDTGSISTVDADDVFLTIENLKQEYKEGETYKFELFAREHFPQLTFTTGSVYSVNNYLPTASKYSIVDNVTDEVIIPFSENSKVSSNATQSYFRQNFKGFEPERFYRIKIKVDDGDTVNIIDKNFTFKLVE